MRARRAGLTFWFCNTQHLFLLLVLLCELSAGEKERAGKHIFPRRALWCIFFILGIMQPAISKSEFFPLP